MRTAAISDAAGVSVWCKRDDRTAEPYGGNKVRKLEWLLGDARARGCAAIVTTGALGSHHVLATAVHGGARGFEVHAVLFPQPFHAHVEDQLRADLKAGATLYPARSYGAVAARMAWIATRLRMKGERAYVIGPGGSSPVGALGYVEAGLELAAQIDRGEAPEPDAIYVAAGSGGTAAGLSIGLAAAGIVTRLVAVRVTDRIGINRTVLGQLVRRTVSLLRRADSRFPDVRREALASLAIDATQLGPGYGAGTPEAEAASRIAAGDDLGLDPTYTSKALAALLADAHAGRVSRPLFWQTLSSASMVPLVADAPPAPGWALRT
jgi:1-aminocyclopropane-1-carboxylate deaminase/D-cysteine desulfhydrase-like pyridoxal-dependent ACC family enzyme